MFYTLNIMGPIYGDQQFRKDLRKITTESIHEITPVADGSHLLRGWKAVEKYGAADVEGIDDIVSFHQREAIAHLKGGGLENRPTTPLLTRISRPFSIRCQVLS